MQNKYFFLGVLLLLLFTSCEQYEPSNDTIYNLPEEGNFYSEVSLQALQEQTADYPENPENYYKIARIYLKQEADSLALYNILTAISLDSVNANYYAILGQIYQKRNEIDKALEACKAAQKMDYPDAELLLLMSDLYLSKKDYKQAKKLLGIAKKSMPQDPRVYFLQGNIAIANYDTATAVRNLKIAIRRKANYVDAYNSLAEMYFKYEMFQTSLYYLNKGLSYKPQNATLNFNKAKIYEERAWVDSAQTYYEKVVKVEPNMYEAILPLGIIAFKKGKYELAQIYLERTVNLKDGLADAHYYLGICYRYKNRDEDALKKFEKTMKLDPQNYAARDYYWSTKNRIANAKIRARNDSLYQVYLKRQQELLQQQIIPQEDNNRFQENVGQEENTEIEEIEE